MAKGSTFEREICVRLSRWWSRGLRDDLYWRSSTSGGRATIRGRKGKSTCGSYGDIAALDPIGKPLLDLITFEIKRGYNKETPMNLIDRMGSSALQTWEKWINQAVESASHAKTPYWAIISKRDKRSELIVMPIMLLAAMRKIKSSLGDSMPSFAMSVSVRNETMEKSGVGHIILDCEIAGFTLDNWLECVHPEHIQELAKGINQ